MEPKSTYTGIYVAPAPFGTTVLSPGEEVGGGVNPSSSTIVQEEGLDVGMGTATQGRNRLSPRGLVGFVEKYASSSMF